MAIGNVAYSCGTCKKLDMTYDEYNEHVLFRLCVIPIKTLTPSEVLSILQKLE